MHALLAARWPLAAWAAYTNTMSQGWSAGSPLRGAGALPTKAWGSMLSSGCCRRWARTSPARLKRTHSWEAIHSTCRRQPQQQQQQHQWQRGQHLRRPARLD